MGSARSTTDPTLAPTVKRAATVAGPLAAVVAFGVIFLTTALAPWFSWPANALSDLGDPGRWPLFWIYNWGMIATGLLGAAFVARTALESRNLAHRASSVVMAIAMLDLSLVGYFHVGRPYHGLVSTVFFVALTYGVMLYGTGEVLEGEDYRGLGLIWLGIVHVTQWALWDPLGLGSGVAIPEFVGAVVVTVWMGAVAARLTEWDLPVGRTPPGTERS